MEPRDELRLSDYAVALRRWWVTILIAALVLGAIGWISGRRGGSHSAQVEISLVSEIIVAEEQQTDAQTPAQVVAQLRSRLSRYDEGIQSSIEVEGVTDADLVRVVGSASDPDVVRDDTVTVATRFVADRRAQRRANAEQSSEFHVSRIVPLEEQIAALSTRLEQLDASGGETLGLQTQLIQAMSALIEHQEQAAASGFLSENANAGLSDPAEPTDVGTSEDGFLGVALGLVAGVLAGVLIVVVRAHVDRRVRTARQVRRLVHEASIVEVVPKGVTVAGLQPLARGLMRLADSVRLGLIVVVGVGESTEAQAPPFVELLDAALEASSADAEDARMRVRLARDADVDAPTERDEAACSAYILLVWSGRTDEHELARLATDLRLSGHRIAAAVLAGVPRHELVWAFDDAAAAMLTPS